MAERKPLVLVNGELSELPSGDSVAACAPAIDGEPNGFVNRSDVTIAWNNATRTITLSGTYDIWANGTRYSKTGDTLAISASEGMHHIHYGSDGVLVESTTFVPEIIDTWCYVASVYWDAANAQAIPWPIAETHGAEMPAEVHAYLHATQGCRYVSGMALTLDATGNGSSDSHCQFTSTSGTIRDEDIPHTVLARSTLTDNLRVLYREGTSNWRMGAASPFPVLTTGTGRAAYNLNTGGSWSLVEVTSGNFVLSHIYAVPGTNHTTGALLAVMGQGQYGTLAAARDAADSEASSLQLSGMPAAEFKLIATLIVQTGNTYGNTVKSRLVQFASGIDYVDWRVSSPVPASAASGGAWGSITGTLSSQTDLQAALDAKAAGSHSHTHNDTTGMQGGTAGEYYHLSSAQYTNLPATITAAGAALLDDADAAAQRTTLGLGTAATTAATDYAAASHTHTGDFAAASHTHTGTYEPADATILKDADIGVTVAAPLVSGTTLKTINGQTLLGSGDLAVGADTATITASENLAAGDFVNIWNDTGTAKARKADATTAGKEAHGFVLATVTSGAAATVSFAGRNTAVTGQTPGDVWLATTAGLASGTAPSGTGNVVQQLGVAISATSINFEIGQPIYKA